MASPDDYAVQLYAELETAGQVRAGGQRPSILPLLIHNGRHPWTAATSIGDLTATPARLPVLAGMRPEDVEDARLAARDLAAFQLQHAYLPVDFYRHREDDARADNAMSVMVRLETASTASDLLPPLLLLRELPERNLAGWLLRWALLRLGVTGETAEEMRRMASLDEFRSQLEETAKGWTEQLLAQGRAEGVEEGRAEGVAAQRASLRRQAALRFGASARRLDPFLDRVDSPAKLSEISAWLMVNTIDQLAAKVEAAAAEDGAH